MKTTPNLNVSALDPAMIPESEPLYFYYCNDGSTVEGPFDWEQIPELLELGAVSRDTAICLAGAEEWSALGGYLPPEEAETGETSDLLAETEEAFEAELPVESAGVTVAMPRAAFAAPYQQPPARRGKWVLATGAVSLVALLGYFGARLFWGDGSGSAAGAAAAGGDGWVWAIEPRYQKADPFGPFGVARVQLAGKWGLIDRTGRELLPCAYDEIEIFPKEKCAAVREGPKWGLVDAEGKILSKPEWEEVQPLVNGFIPVKKDGKWGYADASGKLVIPCTWDNAWRFSAAGTAVVTKETRASRKRGYIDKSGRVITELEWDGAQTMSPEGFGAVRRGDGWALVDKNGRVLGEPQWGMQWRLLRADLGFMPVRKDGKWGLIALDGTVLVEPAWDGLAPAENGVLLSRPGAKSIFVGSGGKTIFESGPWDEARCLQALDDWREKPGFVEGLLAVRSGDKWGFIDEQGKTVIPAEWDSVGNFSEGLVAVKNKNDRDVWKFLAADGSPAFANPDGLKIGDDWRTPRFRNGIVRARGSDSAEVAVDREGKIVGDWSENPWLPESVTIKGINFDYVSRYGRYGYMRNFADKDGKIFMRDVPYPMSTIEDPFPYPGPPRYGLASASGQVLVEPTWDCAEVISPDWVRIWVGGRQGLVNAKGEQILRPEWERVEVVDNGLLLAKDGNRKQVFDRTGKALLPEKLQGAQYVDFYGEGFMARSRNPDGSILWSLCDPSATEPVSFDNASRVYWNGDLAKHGLLWIEERDSGQWSLVRRDGSALGITQEATPAKWLMPDGFGVLVKSDGTKIHIGADGKMLGTTAWEDANRFSEGFASVKSGGKWGFIDTRGKTVVAPEWDEVGDFQNVGTEEKPVLLARVAREGRWGCIDAAGRIVVEPQLDEMDLFAPLYDGRFVALARRGELWGAIAPDGKVIVEPCGTRGRVEDGFVALVVKKEGEEHGNFVYFDADGTKLEWDAIRAIESKGRQSATDALGSGMVIAKNSEEKFGLNDSSGRFVLPPKWNHVAWIGPRIAAAWNDDEGGIFDETGKVLFWDDAKRRLARFDRPDREVTPGEYQKGLVVIEATPVWGYAKLESANK